MSSAVRVNRRRYKMIHVRLGKKAGIVRSDSFYGFDSLNLDEVLGFTLKMTLYVEVLSITNSKTGVVHSFVADADLGPWNVTVIDTTEPQFRKLSELDEYVVAVRDTRQRTHNPLSIFSPQELENLKACFDFIDRDQNGSVDSLEVQLYFEKIRDLEIERAYLKKMDSVSRICDDETDTNSSFVGTVGQSRRKPRSADEKRLHALHSQCYKWAVEFHNHQCERRSRVFLENDMDCDGEISWDEFILNAVVLKKRGLSSIESFIEFRNDLY